MHFKLAIDAWNMLGGQFDWAGLPVAAEILGIDNIELLIMDMILIRNHQQEQMT